MKKNPWSMFGFLSNKKIRTQLYSVYIVAVFVPLTIVGIYLLVYVSNLLTTNYEESLYAEGLRLRTIFSKITTDIYKKTTDVMFDPEINKILTTIEYPTDKINTSVYYCEAINNVIYENIDIEDITIYTDNSYAAQYLHFEPITEELMQTEWIQRATNSFVSFWTTMENVDSNGKSHYYLCLVRRVAGIGSDSQAIMVTRIKDGYLQGQLISKEYPIIIMTDNNMICYSAVQADYGKSIGMDIDWEDNYFQQKGTYWADGKKVFYNVSALNMTNTGSNTFIITTSDSAYYEIRRIIWTCTAILVAALILPALLIFVFTDYFSNRVKILRHEMNKVSNEEYDIIPEFHGEDELSEVFSDLQIMVKNIKEKDARVYKAQLRDKQLQNEQQKMEMKMLASQINPHFLYNTLESIRMQSLTAGNRDVANSIKLLGKSMRYVLENTGTGFITLKKELDYIETYIAIQKMRFGNRVNFQVEVESGLVLEENLILPFLIQPVIENAIVHGLEGITENGHIHLRLALSGEFLQITVADNGMGMNEEELGKLRDNINKNTLNASTSIGLGNINRRIKLCYGREYGLSISSLKDQGTRVFLRLPVKTEE